MTIPVYKGSFETNKRRITQRYLHQCTRARLESDRVNLTFVAGPRGLKRAPFTSAPGSSAQGVENCLQGRATSVPPVQRD